MKLTPKRRAADISDPVEMPLHPILRVKVACTLPFPIEPGKVITYVPEAPLDSDDDK